MSLRPAAMAAAVLAIAVAGPAPAYPRPGRTAWVSAAMAGEPDSYSHEPVISDDGRFVAFHTAASNLVPGDTNGQADVFVRDLETGAIERASVAAGGGQADFNSAAPAISGDGRYVMFASRATNLVPGDLNAQWDVFLKDRTTGAIEVVSVASDGTQGNAISAGGFTKAIAGPGARWVVFESDATNLVAGDANGVRDVFLRDRLEGITTRVSVTRTGAEANGMSATPSMSADGRSIAFASYASNLVTGDANERADVFVKDLENGVLRLISVSTGGDQGNQGSGNPSISADGRYVAFSSGANTLVPADGNSGGNQFGIGDVFVRDVGAGTTERVSVTSAGVEAAAVTGRPEISADGRYVTMQSEASNLVPGDTNRATDAFVHDRLTGTTERVSVNGDGSQAIGGLFGSSRPVASADGSVVAFASDHPGIVPGDTGGGFDSDIFARTRGPELGVVELEGRRAEGRVEVVGAVSMSGALLTVAPDPADDGLAAGGAELTEARLIFRPEQEDLLFRLSVAGFPGLRPPNVPPTQPGAALMGVAGAPGVVYGLRLSFGGVTHEVRAIRAGGSAVPPAAPYFALYRCGASPCAEIARLAGGIGTTGNEVRVAIPVSVLGGPGSVLTGIRAFAALGEAAPGGVHAVDEIPVAGTTIPVPQVRLGMAPADVPAHQVAFDGSAVLANGRFVGSMPDAPPGALRVWARVCIDSWCGSRGTPLAS